MNFLYNNPILKARRQELRNRSTDPEALFWSRIRRRQLNHRFRRQYSVGPYILDFYSPELRLAIELDGNQHTTQDGKIYDQERTSYLEGLGIVTIRYKNEEILNDIENILGDLKNKISLSRFPLSIGETNGRGTGFTLIEVMISMAILLVLIVATAPFTLDFYRRYQLDSERNTLVSLLREARAKSMAGSGITHHGVYIATDSYTIFEGASFESRIASEDHEFDRSDAVTLTGPTEILFNYLTGNSASVSFTLSTAPKQGKIYVNTEGSINWE